MNRFYMTFAAIALLAACEVPPDKASSTLENYGMTEIRLGGYSWLGCGDDYQYASEFSAKNMQGKRVSGVVCCGIGKGCTVKF